MLSTASVLLENFSATGTASSSTYLRGDNTWAVVSSGADVSTVTNQKLFTTSSVTFASVTATTATITNLSFGNTATTLVGFARNILGGSGGALLYQVGPNNTGFLGQGNANNLLVSQGSGLPPRFDSTSSIQVGYAANILGNGVDNGSLLVQDSPNTTAFMPQGSAGWLLVSQGAGSRPAFTGTASIYVNSAVNANNIRGGAANRIPYQSGTDSTGFIAAPTTATTFLAWTGTAYTWTANMDFSISTDPQG